MPRRARPAWRSCLAWVVVHAVHFGGGEDQLQQRRLENIGHLLPAAPETRRAATRVSGSRHARYARMQLGQRRSAERSELPRGHRGSQKVQAALSRPPAHARPVIAHDAQLRQPAWLCSIGPRSQRSSGRKRRFGGQTATGGQLTQCTAAVPQHCG